MPADVTAIRIEDSFKISCDRIMFFTSCTVKHSIHLLLIIICGLSLLTVLYTRRCLFHYITRERPLHGASFLRVANREQQLLG